MILDWNKPQKIKSKEQWIKDGIFDGGPTGGYVPNMSNKDMNKWKAKLTGHKVGCPQVEIRKTA